MSDELLPCPFCGKEANVSECQGRDDRFYVWCDGCCCTVMYRSRQAAIDAWNTRAVEDLAEFIEREGRKRDAND